MQYNRLNLFVMRYLVCVVFLILNIVSYGLADDSVETMSGNAYNDAPAKSEFDELDDFDTFDEFSEFADTQEIETYDPLNGYNRFMTQFNDRVYFWFLKPLAQGYSAIVKEPARQAVGRFFDNLGYPSRVVNNLLQLKIKPAGIETARFGVNTTTGLLGLFDPAYSWLELKPCPEDFGQTLGYYGVGSGFHIVLPFLGPSNLRDVFGELPDYFLDPVIYIDEVEIRLAVTGVKVINFTSLHIEQYDALKKDAFDLYIFLRNAYETKRIKAIEE
ncbi:MAG: VacJ family lipoprotein [Desulfobacteraceae bacterium]|nr:VacJ family lipoprotein [Desulfobacteraceae bacterium]